MEEKELIRKALLGDKQAQEECTEKGIVLPCLCCKNESELLTEEGAFNGETPRQLYYIRCKSYNAVDRLREIENILGDDYDLEHLHLFLRL